MYKHIFKTTFAITLSFAIATATPATEPTQTETLAEAGMAGATTLWIPARYRHDQRSALFIQGKQFSVPGGFSDVAGFLPTEQGYLVAVYQTAQPIEVSLVPATAGGVSVVFYTVTSDGEVISTLGTIPDARHVVVGKNGVFVAQGAGRGTLSYAGYDRNGKSVTGPQGVRFASPALDDGWYVQKVVAEKPNHVETVIMHYGADGSAKVLVEDSIHEDEYNRFANTTAVFIDQPPLADSARTGYVARLYRENSTMSRDFREIRACMTNLASTVRYLGDWCVHVGNARSISLEVAADLALRMAVFGDNSAALAGSQLKPKGFGPATYGTINLSAAKPRSTEKAVFQIAGAGANVARSLFGGNTSTLTANSPNDAYGIITPKGNILVLANEHTLDKPREAINLSSGNRLAPEDVKGFLYQFGVTR